MDGQPRYFGPVHPPQYTWRPFMQNEWRNNNWSSGQPQTGPFLPSHGCILRPPGVHSSFTYGPNGNMNIPKVQQTLVHAPREVQQYLDINTNGSISGNHDRAKQIVSVGGAKSELWCIACEKSFQNSSGLDAHLKSHTKCLFPNCSFVASRQALKLHEIQCHRDGKLQIVLDTPEQIAKWRQERKRNYPTVSNITRKKEQEKQRTESGQTIRAKEFRYNNRQGWKHQRGKRGDYRRGRGKNNQSYSQSRESRHTELNTACSQTNKEDENVASPNENTLDANGKNTEVDEKDTKETGMNSGVLGALACVYAASSSDEDDDNNKEQTQKENIEKANDQSEPAPIQECKEIKLTPGHVHLAGDGKLTRKKELTNRLRSRKKTKKEYTVQKRQKPSLLEMLLAPDIRHERNVILQCLRYIVKKDFFGIGCHGNGSVS